MLRLTLELWPYGKEKAKKLIKEVRITNDGWHDNPVQYANYKVEVRDTLGSEVSIKRRYITDYPRSKYDALYLTYLVLRKLVHEDQLPLDEKAKRDKETSN